MATKGEQSDVDIEKAVVQQPPVAGSQASSASVPEIAGDLGCSHRVDLEKGGQEIKVDVAITEKDCRICHLSLDDSQDTGVPIELGCSCKDDLACAHKQCAEAWFKVKGNKTCEICGSVAKNVHGTGEAEQVENCDDSSSDTPPQQPILVETQSFWRGHRFLNSLLACVVLAFVISWLFRFNVPG